MNRPARILFRVFTLAIGGSERQLSILAAGLCRARFQPLVWCDYTGPLAAALGAAGVPVHCMVLPRHPGLEFDRCIAWIRSVEPDIFQSWTLRGDAMDVTAAKAAGVPAIVTLRGNIRHWDSPGRMRDWERDRNGMTDLFIANCQAAAGVACRFEEIPADKMRVIYNGVPLPAPAPSHALRQELGFDAAAPVIGIAGNLRHVKGHDVLLRAFHRVLAEFPKAKLVVAGANQEPDDRLERLWEDLALQYSVYFLGSRTDIDTIYRGIDYYVHSSRAEGFPNAVMEAMSHGLPVVATAVGGVPELIEDGVHGLLAPPGDPEALAAALLRLLRDPALARRLAAAARERIRLDFGIERLSAAFETEYDRLLGEIGPRTGNLTPPP